MTNETQSPAVKASPTTLTVGEGATGTITVQLATRPSADVTVTLTTSGDVDITVDTDPNANGDQTTLSFTTANWNTAQTVTVSAAQDADTEDHRATVTLDPAGGDYDSVANATVTVTEDDDDADTTAPTVTSGSSGYFKDANLATALSGPVSANDDIYVKVTFSEAVGQTVGEGAAARPQISYAIDGAATRFDIVAAGTALLSGDCRPDEATPADVYECRYTAQASDDGDFDFRVGVETADTDSNKLASAYTHSARIAIDNTAPTFVRASVHRSTLTVTFSEALNESKVPSTDRWNVHVNHSHRAVNAVAVSGAKVTLTLGGGWVPATAHTVTVGYWRSNTAPDLEDPAGNIVLGFDGAKVANGAPTVKSASSGYYADANLSTALTGPVKAGTKIYAKVVFSEDVNHVAGTGNTARPELSYGIAGTATRFDIVAHTATLTTGQCRPDAAHPADVYECLYTPVTADSGDFDFRVGTGTQNTFNTAFASAYTHADKIKIDNTAPTVSSAAVDGTTLTVTFNEDMRETPLPAASAFTLALDQGTAPTASSIAVKGSTATVTLSSAVADGRTVTLTYTKPDTNPLLDLAGNALATIPDASKVSVTNNSDTTGPKPTAASGYYEDANLTTALTGPVKVPTDIYVKVVFDEAVGYKAGDGTDARPDISYAVGSTTTRFDIVSYNTGVKTGDCRPTTSTPGATYQCMYRVASGDNGDFDFRIGTGTKDADDNASAAYTHATKIAIDTTEPTFSSAKVNGATLTVTFSEKLKSTTPHANRWYVDVDEVRRTVSSTSISDEVATLTLASAVTEGQKVTFRYQRTADNPTDMTDLAGNIVQAFGDEDVSNETVEPGGEAVGERADDCRGRVRLVHHCAEDAAERRRERGDHQRQLRRDRRWAVQLHDLDLEHAADGERGDRAG